MLLNDYTLLCGPLSMQAIKQRVKMETKCHDGAHEQMQACEDTSAGGSSLLQKMTGQIQ